MARFTNLGACYTVICEFVDCSRIILINQSTFIPPSNFSPECIWTWYNYAEVLYIKHCYHSVSESNPKCLWSWSNPKNSSSVTGKFPECFRTIQTIQSTLISTTLDPKVFLNQIFFCRAYLSSSWKVLRVYQNHNILLYRALLSRHWEVPRVFLNLVWLHKAFLPILLWFLEYTRIKYNYIQRTYVSSQITFNLLVK